MNFDNARLLAHELERMNPVWVMERRMPFDIIHPRNCWDSYMFDMNKKIGTSDA